MSEVNITTNETNNFLDLKDANKEGTEGLMKAYNKEQQEQVLLIGSIYQDPQGRNQFMPHAEVLDLDESEVDSAYVLQADDEFEQLTS